MMHSLDVCFVAKQMSGLRVVHDEDAAIDVSDSQQDTSKRTHVVRAEQDTVKNCVILHITLLREAVDSLLWPHLDDELRALLIVMGVRVIAPVTMDRH
jgi:hypothetical protein